MKYDECDFYIPGYTKYSGIGFEYDLEYGYSVITRNDFDIWLDDIRDYVVKDEDRKYLYIFASRDDKNRFELRDYIIMMTYEKRDGYYNVYISGVDFDALKHSNIHIDEYEEYDYNTILRVNDIYDFFYRIVCTKKKLDINENKIIITME